MMEFMHFIGYGRFVASILVSATITMAGEPGFQTESLVLYQPDAVLQERISDVGALADYYKKLDGLCQKHFANEKVAANLDLVVVIKPGAEARVWFVSSIEKLPSRPADLQKVILAVQPPRVTSGPVAFAIRGLIAGGLKRVSETTNPLPIPQAWKDAARAAGDNGPFLMPEGYLKHVWPESLVGQKVKATQQELKFETQVLEPTGGRIQKPKHWHYREAHQKSGYMWTLSEEDSAKGSYVTGVRIQVFTGVREATGKTAREFLREFAEAKEAQVDKVVEVCKERKAGLFTRACLEVEEGDDHILYSMFWGNEDLDIAVISIAGTTKLLWKEKAPFFDRMKDFELIDMKRFEKK